MLDIDNKRSYLDIGTLNEKLDLEVKKYDNHGLEPKAVTPNIKEFGTFLLPTNTGARTDDIVLKEVKY